MSAILPGTTVVVPASNVAVSTTGDDLGSDHVLTESPTDAGLKSKTDLKLPQTMAAAESPSKGAYPLLDKFLTSDGTRIRISNSNWEDFTKQFAAIEFKAELVAFATKMSKPTIEPDRFITRRQNLSTITEIEAKLMTGLLDNIERKGAALEIARNIIAHHSQLTNQKKASDLAIMFTNLRASIQE
jgi:hypothetical protein